MAGAGFGTTAAASNEARIREIGGRIPVFFLGSPSWDFLCGFFSSISETVSARVAGAGFTGGLGAGRSGVCFFSAGACGARAAGLWAGSAFFAGALAFEAAGLWAAGVFAVLCAADFRAVLLVVFVGIAIV